MTKIKIKKLLSCSCLLMFFALVMLPLGACQAPQEEPAADAPAAAVHETTEEAQPETAGDEAMPGDASGQDMTGETDEQMGDEDSMDAMDHEGHDDSGSEEGSEGSEPIK